MELNYLQLLLFTIPFAFAYFLKVWFKRKSYLDYLIPCFIFFALGLNALFSSIAQIFLSNDIAAFLNQAPNPFIKELGFANLGMGLAAIIGVFFGGNKILFFSSLALALYLSFSAMSHLYEILLNFSALGEIANLSTFTWMTLSDWLLVDFITPFTFFTLYLLRSRYE